MRLIDADALKARIMVDAPDFLDGGSSITKAFILAMLGTRNATPTIDAVPVVRCQDCKHGEPCNEGDVYCNKDIGTFESPVHKPDWFCADGERKREDD